jgi:hypothetical protein
MKTSEAQARVLLDETGVTSAMARRSARAPHGKRADAAPPLNTGKTITVWGARSLEGIMAAMTVAGRTDTQGCFTEVQTMRVPTWRPGPVVRMDTLSSQNDERIQSAIDAVGATLDYVPPDSPDGSPIEPGWSKVTAILRATAARTRATRDAAITHALTRVTPHDAQGWVAHGGYLSHIQLGTALGPQ